MNVRTGAWCLALALSALCTPAYAAEAVWTHVPQYGGPPHVTNGGWAVHDARRDRFLHHPGSYYVPPVLHFNGYFVYPPGTYAIQPDAWTPWSVAQTDGALPAVEGASAVYDSVADRVLVFGGWSRATTTPVVEGGLWALDLAAGTGWQAVATTGAAPRPRHDAALALDTRRHRLLLFGGRTATGGVLNDLWALPLDAPAAWESLSVSGAPPVRETHATVYDPDRDRLWIVCGRDSDGTPRSDAWVFDCAGGSWSDAGASGPAPDGPTGAVYDRAQQRLITYSPGDPPRLRTLSTGPVPAWEEPVTDRPGPGRSFLPGVPWDATPTTVAVAFRTSPRALIVLWERYAAGYWTEESDAALLRFTPLPRVAMSVSLAQVTFSRGTTGLTWSMPADRSALERVQVWNAAGGRATGFPDSLGYFAFPQGGLAPGTRYTYRVSWFDGIAMRDTGDFIVDTPPHPVDIGFAIDSVAFHGTDVDVFYSAPDDSARMLSTQAIQHRIPPGDWTTLWEPAGLSATGYWLETQAMFDTVYEYRAGWGDPANRHWSEPYPVRTTSYPHLVSIKGAVDGVSARWTVRPGFPFVGSWHRFPNGLPGEDVVVATVTANPDGSIAAHDDAVTEGTWIYNLSWDIGGVLWGDTGYAVDVPHRDVPPPPDSTAVAGLAGFVNPARGAIAFTVLVPPSDHAKVTVVDVAGRVKWRGEFGPGQHAVSFTGHDWPAGIYLVRLVSGPRDLTSRLALIR